MKNLNSSIEIDKDNICYGSEVLKISNISRTWVFRFQNKEKKAYESEVMKYEIIKRNYEIKEKYKKKEDVKKYSVLCILTALFAINILRVNILGLLFLAISVACGFIAFKKYKKDIKYDQEPPVKKEFKNKFGLGIEMNSGYVVVFAADGKEGEKALKKLQNDIKNAYTHSEKTVFNMNEYNVKVEGDIDGIINLGDDNVNVNNGKELLNI